MCTAISWLWNDHYFGRNLDLEYGYNETITITPRNTPFSFRMAGQSDSHYAMIGMSTVIDGYPLYYEATNEKGLSMAGLNFPGNAVYLPPLDDHINVTPFEFIPWLLGQCSCIEDAKSLLCNVNLINVSFSPEYPLSPLHWLIADRDQSIVVEPMADGLKIFDNPVGVLTNNPPFDFHLHNLGLYLNVTPDQAVSRFSANYPMKPWSSGMGGLGLPGDFSSASRFVKAAFTKLNSQCGHSESGSISQFFHILSSVTQQRGLTCVRDEEYEFTRYSSCCNTTRGIYYYTTYENSQITAVDMHRENLDGMHIISYPLITGQQIHYQN
jgi:choloylglycine hydrolase